MKYGICPLSIVPVRADKEYMAEMTSQLLYGEGFKVLEQQKKWSKIRNAYDHHEGWVENGQYREITEDEYKGLTSGAEELSQDLIAHIALSNQSLMPILFGSITSGSQLLKHHFEGNAVQGAKKKKNLVETALLYLNAPFLSGGKTPFGVDASGFSQMVYRINGYQLKRDVEEQSREGQALSFIEESEPGDLAFFDDKEARIDHVGIILPDNYIIHVNGRVRIDRLDHTGIFNTEINRYTHQLRVIKKIA
ncbi:NlpC/P60 family protein [Allomuricauda sp. SCSIO 65647]|uniref:C40 family peptidase n=1 Tax=Allomuricauda sp. SCSIO 65647 TaxID=2908843 RepID=UPI001F31531D|nr:NlpC/P60 family protein [Muricauda sp. SCSIO 65647]UJH66965.1 C40 family peptidase [Muricauda sp. SCSIO 65647]